MALPEFIIIGAMKCGTSTLHRQIAAAPGFFMATPKEPNFFSDDDVYGRGMGWYQGLFDAAEAGNLKGEASTHYTKRPTHPAAFERLVAAMPDVKLIYMMRHPIDRLVSHFVHEWTMKEAAGGIDEAARPDTPYTDYSRYAYQLEPFLEHFGRDKIMPVFLERLNAEPDEQFDKIVRFLGRPDGARWRHDLGALNVSEDRIRQFPFYDVLINSAPATAVRRALAPAGLRDWIKQRLQMRDRPVLSAARQSEIAQLFDEDLAQLGRLFGVRLNCKNFTETVCARDLDWIERG